MFKRFSIRELIFIALMAAFSFVINLMIGSGIVIITGVPGASGFVTGITGGITMYLVARIVPKLGSVTISQFLYATLAIPTVMAGGPPGFFWKVPIMTLFAFGFDLIISLFHHRMKGFVIGLPISAAFGFAGYAWVYWMLGMPELEKILVIWPIMLVIYTVLAFVGFWIGSKIFERVKNKKAVRQISG